jgi:hypothetical protein
MPASPGPKRIGQGRPNRPATFEDLSDWKLRAFPALAAGRRPPPGQLELDDVLPELDEALDDPELAAVTIAEELAVAAAGG